MNARTSAKNISHAIACAIVSISYVRCNDDWGWQQQRWGRLVCICNRIAYHRTPTGVTRLFWVRSSLCTQVYSGAQQPLHSIFAQSSDSKKFEIDVTYHEQISAVTTLVPASGEALNLAAMFHQSGGFSTFFFFKFSSLELTFMGQLDTKFGSQMGQLATWGLVAARHYQWMYRENCRRRGCARAKVFSSIRVI